MAAYKAAYGKDPGTYAAEAYDSPLAMLLPASLPARDPGQACIDFT